MPDCSVDAVVTDPPYGLSFMGKKWDYDVPSVEVWAECLRVLKPGGHLLAFAGTRTQHRMAVRIEDAGFEIRDMIAWVYGSGFPKSLDVSKAIELQAIAMDFARLRGIDLSTASDLVGKVFSGNTSILSRYGFTVEKGTTATQALAMIQKAAAGQAEAYGQTTQGALESIQISIDNTVEDIGRVVLPILAEVLTAFRDTSEKVAAAVAECRRLGIEVRPPAESGVTARPGGGW